MYLRSRIVCSPSIPPRYGSYNGEGTGCFRRQLTCHSRAIAVYIRSARVSSLLQSSSVRVGALQEQGGAELELSSRVWFVHLSNQIS